ncbi:MAG: mechanosensitive ion channel family protein [Fusobacteriaceae bacterium]
MNFSNFVEDIRKYLEESLKATSMSSNLSDYVTGKPIIELVVIIIFRVVLKVGIVILVYFVMKKILKKIKAKILDIEEKRRVNKSALGFSFSVIRTTVYIVFALYSLKLFGLSNIETATVLGAAGVGIGFALKDIVGNFIGGINILAFKPYSIGQFVEINTFQGEVTEINIFATELTTVDNKKIFIPNGKIIISEVINFTSHKTRRVEHKFSISYTDNFKTAISILESIADNHEKVLKKSKEKQRMIRVIELAESSVKIIFRVWCRREDYWDVYFDTLEQAKETFDREGIKIPFPQTDVHLKTKI